MDAATDAILNPIMAGAPRLFILAAVICFIAGGAWVGWRQISDDRGSNSLAKDLIILFLTVAGVAMLGPVVSLIPGMGGV